jgi:hypothetical protein
MVLMIIYVKAFIVRYQEEDQEKWGEVEWVLDWKKSEEKYVERIRRRIVILIWQILRKHQNCVKIQFKIIIPNRNEL